MAQTAGVLVLRSIPERDSKIVFLVSVDAARFRKPSSRAISYASK